MTILARSAFGLPWQLLYHCPPSFAGLALLVQACRRFQERWYLCSCFFLDVYCGRHRGRASLEKAQAQPAAIRLMMRTSIMDLKANGRAGQAILE